LVILTEQAKSDLQQIYSFIVKTSPIYAAGLLDSLIEKIEGIDLFPERGRIVPEINEDAVREIFHLPYRIIYEIYPDIVIVLGIVHAKRDFDTAFAGRK
jgi:plasmid stabilization system protein ParE